MPAKETKLRKVEVSPKCYAILLSKAGSMPQKQHLRMILAYSLEAAIDAAMKFVADKFGENPQEYILSGYQYIDLNQAVSAINSDYFKELSSGEVGRVFEVNDILLQISSKETSKEDAKKILKENEGKLSEESKKFAQDIINKKKNEGV